MDFEGEVSNMKGEFYFLPEGVENFNEKNALKPNFDSNYYVDAAGWRVYSPTASSTEWTMLKNSSGLAAIWRRNSSRVAVWGFQMKKP